MTDILYGNKGPPSTPASPPGKKLANVPGRRVAPDSIEAGGNLAYKRISIEIPKPKHAVIRKTDATLISATRENLF